MSILAANTHIVYREVLLRDPQNQLSGGGSCLFWSRSPGFGVDGRRGEWRKTKKRDFRVEAFWPDMTRPNVIEMQPIKDCDQLDQILARAQELPQPIIIDWSLSLSVKMLPLLSVHGFLIWVFFGSVFTCFLFSFSVCRMAAWCRKCIYLKPKLEKLAAEYDTKYNLPLSCSLSLYCQTTCMIL